MSGMKDLGCAILAAGAMALFVAPPQQVRAAESTPATSAHASFDRIVEEALREQIAAGAVIAISEKGTTRLIRGYGLENLENKTPVTADTVFRIGSVTKQFTAAAVMLLAEQGKLSIEDPLSKFLPDFPRARDVTLRQLLNHTAGIHNYTAQKDFERAERQDYTTDEMVGYIARMGKVYDFEPGTAWNYSNSNYMLLGAVIEKVSGQPLGRFLKTSIFDPLGLRHTAMDDLAEIVPNRAQGYERSKSAPTGFVNTTYTSMGVAAGAGAMRSTAADLLKWQAALFGGKLLKPESLAMMIEPARLKDGRLSSSGRPSAPLASPLGEYGFGLILKPQEGRRTIGHTGSINGFNAWTLYFPDDQASIVILTNTSGGALRIGPKILKAYRETQGN